MPKDHKSVSFPEDIEPKAGISPKSRRKLKTKEVAKTTSDAKHGNIVNAGAATKPGMGGKAKDPLGDTTRSFSPPSIKPDIDYRKLAG